MTIVRACSRYRRPRRARTRLKCSEPVWTERYKISVVSGIAAFLKDTNAVRVAFRRPPCS